MDIEGEEVHLTSPARTVVELYEYRRLVPPGVPRVVLAAHRRDRGDPAKVADLARRWRVAGPVLRDLDAVA